jgi:transposase
VTGWSVAERSNLPDTCLCLEYGIAIRQGAVVFKLDLPRVPADEANDRTPAMQSLLIELFADLKQLKSRMLKVT